MIVKECMTTKVEMVTPDMKITEAAKKMRDGDFGVMPVQENDKLVGMLTDRDIVIRCVAEGKNNMAVGEVMSNKVLYCFEDQDIDEVAENLGDNQIRRLPVLNRKKKLVGILSLGDMTQGRDIDPAHLESAMNKISQPGLIR